MAPPSQNISILNGPASGQKNLVVCGNHSSNNNANLTQVVTAPRDFELEQIREANRSNSGLHTGRDYMTHPNELEAGRGAVVVKRLKQPRKNS